MIQICRVVRRREHDRCRRRAYRRAPPPRAERAARGRAGERAFRQPVVLSATEASALIVRMARDERSAGFRRPLRLLFPARESLSACGPAHRPTAAEELAQETMLRVWRKAGSFDPDAGAASTWIFVIARNLRIDRLRGRARADRSDLDPSEEPRRAADGRNDRHHARSAAERVRTGARRAFARTGAHHRALLFRRAAAFGNRARARHCRSAR